MKSDPSIKIWARASIALLVFFFLGETVFRIYYSSKFNDWEIFRHPTKLIDQYYPDIYATSKKKIKRLLAQI